MTSSDRDREIAEQYREKATEIGKSMSESGISGGEHVSPTYEGAQFKPSDTPAKEQQTPEGNNTKWQDHVNNEREESNFQGMTHETKDNTWQERLADQEQKSLSQEKPAPDGYEHRSSVDPERAKADYIQSKSLDGQQKNETVQPDKDSSEKADNNDARSDYMKEKGLDKTEEREYQPPEPSEPEKEE